MHGLQGRQQFCDVQVHVTVQFGTHCDPVTKSSLVAKEHSDTLSL